MTRRNWIIAGAIVAASLAGMIACPFWPAAQTALAMLVAAVFVFTAVSARRKTKAEYEQLLVRTVNLQRHDWMNDLQVLLGYIRLKKAEKIDDYVEKIRCKALQDSFVSRLGIRELIVYLMSFRVQKRKFALEIDMEREIRLHELPVSEKAAARLLIGAIECFHLHALPPADEPNALSVALDADERALLLDFAYTGAYEHEALQRQLDRLIRSFSRVEPVEQHFADEQAVVSLRLSFRG